MIRLAGHSAPSPGLYKSRQVEEISCLCPCLPRPPLLLPKGAHWACQALGSRQSLLGRSAVRAFTARACLQPKPPRQGPSKRQGALAAAKVNPSQVIHSMPLARKAANG
ncbi:hypothetical protein WJX72_005768 [[Myrmecia] bisecta]|uniref:Uncharacterized protein n=1 Tax=[Myrmecia] bisecta TaxID=41462 RepID=A0AAW1QQM9_9CHLO